MGMKILNNFFIRSETNNKDLCKQYFTVIKKDGYEPTLVIVKLVYSNDYELYHTEHEVLRTFRDKFLFRQVFGLKIETLDMVVNELHKNK